MKRQNNKNGMGIGVCLLAMICAVFTVRGGEIGTVSRFGQTLGTAGEGSYAPRFSADGKSLLFLSHAGNVSSNKGGDELSLYSLNIINREVRLISVGAGGNLARGWSAFASTSSNGQYVVFESNAGNLGHADTNRSSDVFVRDVVAGTTTLVSVGTNGNAGAGESKNAVMTPDGRWLAFESTAKDLATVWWSSRMNVILKDLSNGTTISVVGNIFPFDGEAHSPAVTPDGKKIAFVCDRFISPGGGNPLGGVYIRHMHANDYSYAGRGTDKIIPAPYRCFFPKISDNGHQVLFKAFSMSNEITYVCFFDNSNYVTTVVSTNADHLTAPAFSGNARLVVSENNSNVFLWNLETGTNQLISVNASGIGPGNGRSYGPVVSDDFTRVAFVSEATDLVTNLCNGRPHLFVRDLVSGVTRLVSADTNGVGSGDFTGITPSLSPSGDLVAFDSVEANLVPNDRNGESDVFLYFWASNALTVVTVETAGKENKTGRSTSFTGRQAVSANGRYVAFSTLDTNVYAGSTNAVHFLVWDTWLNQNVVQTPFTNVANGAEEPLLSAEIGIPPAVLSEDGRAVAYVRQQFDYLGRPEAATLYRLDLQTSELRIGAPNRNPSSSSEVSMNPAMSADGKFVAFQSDASSLSDSIADTNNQTDVFFYDAEVGTTNLLSVSEVGNTVGNGTSVSPFVTADGKWAFFRSTASNLSTNLPASYTAGRQIQYARDLTAGKTYALGALGLDYVSPGYPVLDASNRVVFFDAANLCCNPRPVMVLGFDMVTRSNIFVATNCANPSVSGDGQYLAYQKRRSASNSDVYVRDLQSGVEGLVTIGLDGTTNSNGRCTNVIISADGRFIVFSSTASNLVPGDDNGVSDIFVRDRVLGVTTLLSVNRDGTGPGAGPGAGASFQPVMSRDGRTVVFQSFAGDLAEGDYNNFRDVFVARLGGVDSDSDGLDDDWEVAFFGDLSRNGTGDFDGDGQTDSQEFMAGTNPKNDGSILRVMTVSGLNSGVVTVLWNSVPGRTYRVQYKDDLGGSSWKELAGAVVATATSASKQDGQAVARRFYRVVAGGE